MKKLRQNSLCVALISVAMVLAVASCSDEKPASTNKAVEAEKSAKESYETFEVKPDTEVTQVERLKFEHDFAAQCVERELKDSNNKEQDEERVTKLCECITKEVSKTLTDEEAEKFVGEHENPRSLGIKFENASFQCMPEKTAASPGFSHQVTEQPTTQPAVEKPAEQ